MQDTHIISQSPNNHTKNVSIKAIAWTTGALTLLLALFSFVLSFNALTDLAEQQGISIPALFPLIVEFAVVIFSLNALYRSLAGEDAKVQWTLIIGASLLAGTFNVFHADKDLLSRTMAAMPSLFLLLSFETFIGQIKHAVKRSNVIQSLEQLTDELNSKRQELDTLIEQKQAELDSLVQTKQSEVDRLTQQADELRSSIEQSQATLAQLHQEIEQAKTVQHSSLEQARTSKAKQDKSSIEQRRARLVDILHSEGDLGVSALAEKLNTSRGTVYSDLKALSAAGHIVKNGSGWEVAG